MARPRRTITLADAMLLVSVSAFGLAVFQFLNKNIVREPWLDHLFSRPGSGWNTGLVTVRAVQAIGVALPFVGAWTALVPILRLRPPRPRMRGILREPGTMACLAVYPGLIWALLGLGGTYALDRAVGSRYFISAENWSFHFLIEEVFPYLGLSVATAWVVLAGTGCWRRSSDWIDRFGRSLGVFWIIAGLIWSCRRYLALTGY